MSSIRLRLLKWLLGPILLVNLVLAALVTGLAWTPAQVAFDGGLLDTANGLAARLAAGAAPQLPPGGADADRSWFVVRDGHGRLLAGAAGFPALRPGAAPYDAEVDGEPVGWSHWRCGRPTVSAIWAWRAPCASGSRCARPSCARWWCWSRW